MHVNEEKNNLDTKINDLTCIVDSRANSRNSI